ncbi:transposable element Tcb2 transposase [Trichonephila clavipes]|nr:transposable element Tcb2 transposase [Trichonephila clavipes]
MNSSMSSILRATNSKQSSGSNNFGFEMVCNENSQQKIGLKTTSGCFYPRSNHWEVGGRLQSSELLTASFHDFGDNFKLQEQLSGGSVVVVHEEPHPQMTGTLSYRPEETTGEIARHTTQATGRPISRFTVARRLHGGGLFARRPVRCVPLTPAHRKRRSLWCREHRNWRDNEWGRVLFLQMRADSV